jgi:hypothetical protein
VTVVGIDFDLPDGWWCLDLDDPKLTERFDALRADGRTITPESERRAAAELRGLAERGTTIALLRPADDERPVAVCGGVFVGAGLDVDGVELFRTLDDDGEPVAIGDLGGIPIVSHIRRERVDHHQPAPILQITYFICPPGMCIVVIFVASEIVAANCIVNDVATVMSAARVVHSDDGCPV